MLIKFIDENNKVFQGVIINFLTNPLFSGMVFHKVTTIDIQEVRAASIVKMFMKDASEQHNITSRFSWFVDMTI